MILKAHFKLTVKKTLRQDLGTKMFWTDPHGLVNILESNFTLNLILVLSGFEQVGPDCGTIQMFKYSRHFPQCNLGLCFHFR